MPPGKDKQPVVLLNSITVYFQLSVKCTTNNEEVFSTLTPPDLDLGELFNHFINIKIKNRKFYIDIIDETNNYCGWKFHTKGLLGLKNRELDPSVSIRKNKIDEFAIIIARRV